MHNDKESPFALTLAGIGRRWPVTRFKGQEGLNQIYRFEVQLTGPAPALDIAQWLQTPAFLSLGEDHGIHGMIDSASVEYRHPQQTVYHLVLVPALHSLDRSPKRRVWHAMSVPQILRQLLDEHGESPQPYRLELDDRHYPVRPFCIQYAESDLQWLQRLCEEEGIHYHFTHQPDGHVLVLADDTLNFAPEPLVTPFHSGSLQEVARPVIWSLFQRHGQPAEGTTQPGTHPQQLSRRTLERLRARHGQIHGHSTRAELLSSRIVQVEQHPISPFNDQWLLIETLHQYQQATTASPFYRNQFTAIPWATPFRPPLKQPRPSIPGYQRGRVLGTQGQRAVLDEQGRLHVSLWPDETEEVGLWLPWMRPLANQPSRLPWAGAEVLVSFLDHDPDRPVVCGVLDQPVPPPASPPRGDAQLLFDWLLYGPDITP